MTRLKPKKLSSLDEFNHAVEKVSMLSTSLRLHTDKRDEAIQEAQDRFKDPIAAINAEIDSLLTLCDTYASEHRAELFTGTAKSAKNEFATYGYRDGNPALKLLNKRHTWETVKAAHKANGHVAVWEIDKAYNRAVETQKAFSDAAAFASPDLKKMRRAEARFADACILLFRAMRAYRAAMVTQTRSPKLQNPT